MIEMLNEKILRKIFFTSELHFCICPLLYISIYEQLIHLSIQKEKGYLAFIYNIFTEIFVIPVSSICFGQLAFIFFSSLCSLP